MSAAIIDGKKLAAAVKAEAAAEVQQLKEQGVVPCLAVLLVMAIGVTIPIFIFKRISFRATRQI